MKVIHTLRNARYYPSSDQELEMLRAQKWERYSPPSAVNVQVKDQNFAMRPGLTLTPFANAVPCNAHCRFCSEELQRVGNHSLTAAQLIQDYDQYFAGLASALGMLRNLPVGLSLSGLEATAEPKWLLRLLALLEDLQPHFVFDEKVLYTNGTGLYKYPELVEALQAAGFDRIELSRCHYDQAINQKIMYINRNEPIWQNEPYEAMVQQLVGRLRLKNSCILTAQGIHSLAEMEAYLDWALALGVKEVVFRELSRLDEGYVTNATALWVAQNRIPIEPILAEIAPSRDATRAQWTYDSSTLGYYYYNEHFYYRGQIEVIVETSSYPALCAANASGLVQKLVFHSNGNLCGDWDPQAYVLANFFA